MREKRDEALMNNKSFDHKRIAEGYANRPWLHKSVMLQLQQDLKVGGNFKNGLDVGCGAGLSTKALKLLCNKVTGTDISKAMIEVCKELYENPAYSFYVAGAEETKIPAEPYDIVTAAGVINWVDKDKFLKNMNCVMASGGLLVIYDFRITDRMVGSDAYTQWYQQEYLKNFPKPPRKENVWTQDNVGENFIIENQITYEMQYEFDRDSFIDFMMIQSNVNVQIETGKKAEAEIRKWMEEMLGPVFGGERRRLIFEGYSWYLRHI